jgi:glycosidase
MRKAFGEIPVGGSPWFHFHVARDVRRTYNFGRELFALNGNVVFIDLHAVRLFTQKINETRRASGDARFLRAGDMNAMGLIDEVLHYMTRLFIRQAAPGVVGKALAFLDERLGEEGVNGILRAFLDRFPPPEVFEESRSVVQFLKETTGGTSNREIAMEELLHLRLANINPAFEPFLELFDHAELSRHPEYRRAGESLEEFFRSQPVFGPDNQDLVSLLRAPVIASPRSLSGQLDFIRSRWGYLLGDLLVKLLTGIDLIKEEDKLLFAFFTPGPPEVLEYAGQYAEPEAFSVDKDWMPKVVMVAKNALVWLDQLSRRHGRPIIRLDQVPDEELDRLGRAGFTALWLIGVWERSGASRRIKRMMGNPEAEASAYSLFDYEVARDLGGEEALANLRDRAWRRGIRLASDMVPNHTGIDSRWMIEHPDRFLAYPRPYPPFPTYSFNGPNLTEDPRVGVFLEDHYFNRSDAAVTFKRIDFSTGNTRYIYHGNDGTHMPWNDTAQLDFLNPETRETVIRTILRVASMFPIIRFDAAMTLTKRHFQRLWFPEPGKGGDIPSRAECGLTRHDFDRAIPNEFWREVVDRVAAELPDTLLLAEAFWLLEGFFVRTLGMHRVYNSAFMNMLKTEDNAKYRQTIKNTMEFDPEVLKRFVNFMSNPDEDTAFAQFGDQDKYFGVCTLLATLPGLPMFAHGQVEGYREKYGMEFRRAYGNETPIEGFVGRHEREIFPLLKKRYLFCGVEGFLLYDLYEPSGSVNEDVFAYSNSCGGERGLVLYNNRYTEARGWIRTSAAFAVKRPGGKFLVQKTLGDGLSLSGADNSFVIFRDHVRNLEYIRSCTDLRAKGLFVNLGAFQYQVFLDFREVMDDSQGRWSRLAGELDGQGIPSIDSAFREMDLRLILEPFRALLNADMCARLRTERQAMTASGTANREKLLAGAETDYRRFLAGIKIREPEGIEEASAMKEFAKLGRAVMAAPFLEETTLPMLWAWTLLQPLCGAPEKSGRCPVVSWLDEWMMGGVIRDCCLSMGWDGETAMRSPALIALLLENRGRQISAASIGGLLARGEAESFLRVNLFEGTRWFHKESLELLAAALFDSAAAASARETEDAESAAQAADAAPAKDRSLLSSWVAAAGSSGYRWDVFIETLSRKERKAPRGRSKRR